MWLQGCMCENYRESTVGDGINDYLNALPMLLYLLTFITVLPTAFFSCCALNTHPLSYWFMQEITFLPCMFTRNNSKLMTSVTHCDPVITSRVISMVILALLQHNLHHLLIADVEVGPDFIDMCVLWAAFPEKPLQIKCSWSTVVPIGVYFDRCVSADLPWF